MTVRHWTWAAIVVAVAAGVFGIHRWWTDSAIRADPADAELVRLGAGLYSGHCASCHGANLEGEPNWRERRPDGTLPSPPHDASGHTWHHSDQVLFDITKHGGQRNAPPGFVSRMPGFAATLSDREIRAILAHIKSRWPVEIRQRQERINQRSR